MKLGFEAKRLFNNRTGLGNYSRTLVNNLLQYYPEENYFLYTPDFEIEEYQSEYLNNSKVKVRTSQKKHEAHWRSFGIKKDIINDQLDIYHGLSHELPRNNDKLSCAKVVTIHDLIFRRHPEYFPIFDRSIYGLKCKHAIHTSDVIIAISESTKRDILKFYNVPEDKIQVVYQACDHRFYNNLLNKSDDINLPSDYNLFVGSIEPRKNLEVVIDAYAELPKDLQIPFLLIGRGKESYVKLIRERIKEKKLEQVIQIKSNISTDALVSIYRKATTLVYVSNYEGFGLPVAEALLSKTPVVTSSNSSLQEAGGPDTIYVQADHIDSVVNGISIAMTDSTRRTSMVENGYQYAISKFDPELLTNQMINVYKKVCKYI